MELEQADWVAIHIILGGTAILVFLAAAALGKYLGSGWFY